MFFTIRELFDIVLMTVVVGYIFMDLFRQHQTDGNAFWFACAVTAPALIVHELAHKFVAVSFGLGATFHAAYFWLVLGIVLKLLRSGFIFFVPAYVSIGAASVTTITPMASGLIAFAGPFLNLVLFVGAWTLLKQKKLKRKTFVMLHVTKQINLFLFIFNMLPIPFFDGLKVYQGIFNVFF